ncbi:hypothetical protein ECMP0210175_1349 [Escherichia coli MP021017.5]|nr:hypothetical protein ECMP0210175_1349 [Escherichia coli MP021017.5]EMU96867.1 hypothetical protein ECMP0210174_1197 [Escherichia coli MP021017.4]ENA18154.1 hypothetical protein ECBCE008MS13_1502 [Escherichia coli BCE008_MS-13]
MAMQRESYGIPGNISGYTLKQCFAFQCFKSVFFQFIGDAANLLI